MLHLIGIYHLDNMGELYKRTIARYKKRRENILNGGVNCIPSPFKRFNRDFCGIEQETYYLITSYTNGGKSQLASYLFVYNTIMFCYYTKANVDFKIIYFPLEETEERLIDRFLSWFLYNKSGRKIRIAPSELRCTTEAFSDYIMDLLTKFDVENIVDYFEEHVIIPEELGNPTGMYKWCKKYAEEHGTVHYKKVRIKDELGVEQEREVFNSYEQDNPNEYRIIITDTVNLIEQERGMSKKEAIDKYSEYNTKYLRNRYHYSILGVQQQNTDGASTESVKIGRVRPTKEGLGDSKYTGNDANVILGLFSPMKFNMPEYLGYDVTILQDRLRFLEVLKSRDGSCGGIIPLWFDGAVCDFKELPKADDKDAMDKIYAYCKKLDAGLIPQVSTPVSSSPSKATSLLLSTKNAVKHFINYKI